MTNRKISELSEFQGKKILLLAQQEGAAIFAKDGLIPPDVTAVTIIGLVKILIERGIIEDR